MRAEATPSVVLTIVDAFLLTVVDGEEPFHGWMTVDASGRIAGIGPGRPTELTGEVLDARGCLVAPGFVSAHSHLHTSGLRGISADDRLYPWARANARVIGAAEPEDMYWFTLHGCLDFLANGITSAFNFPQNEVLSLYDPVAGGTGHVQRREQEFLTRQFDAAADSGLRVMSAIRLDDEPAGGPDDTAVHERFDRLAQELVERMPTDQHLGAAVYGAVQWSAGPRTARLEAEVMDRHGVLNQAHFLETTDDLAGQRAKFAWYADSGALSPRMVFGHFVHPTHAMVEAAAAHGARMAWQPTSNGRLGSGVADVVRYRRAGIGVGVGLDDQSCTDTSDPFANMRLGMYSQRARYSDASVLGARDMLRLHTLGSAEVLGVADRIGSLAPGKLADFLIIDPTSPDTGPMWDPWATYVLACGLRNLVEVRVGGRPVSRSGRSYHPASGRVRQELHGRVVATARRAGVPAPSSALFRPSGAAACASP